MNKFRDMEELILPSRDSSTHVGEREYLSQDEVSKLVIASSKFICKWLNIITLPPLEVISGKK